MKSVNKNKNKYVRKVQKQTKEINESEKNITVR